MENNTLGAQGEDDLYAPGAATLLASWEEYARGSAGARLERMAGVAAGVFPSEPERSVYNNAVLSRGLGPAERATALDAMQAAYAAEGIDDYAAWAHESDAEMLDELGGRGYRVVETTRAMGLRLDDLPPASTEVDLEPIDWDDYLSYLERVGVPAGLLRGADPDAFHLLGARRDGEYVASALAIDHEGDCGIYNMSTIASARRHGIGAALTARHLRDAAGRGCSTATLQATPMAERVYAAAGFRDLGRFLEHVR